MSVSRDLVELLRPCYDKKIYNPDEMLEDIARLVSVGRSLNKWKKGKPINPRLVVNNMVIFFNVFGPQIEIILGYASKIGVRQEMLTLLVFLRRLDRRGVQMVDIDLYECLTKGIHD